MSASSEDPIALLNKLDKSSFASDVDQIRAREAARSLLARLEAPRDTIWRVFWSEVRNCDARHKCLMLTEMLIWNSRQWLQACKCAAMSICLVNGTIEVGAPSLGAN